MVLGRGVEMTDGETRPDLRPIWSRENRVASSLDVAREREKEIIFWLKQLGAIYCLDIY